MGVSKVHKFFAHFCRVTEKDVKISKHLTKFKEILGKSCAEWKNFLCSLKKKKFISFLPPTSRFRLQVHKTGQIFWKIGHSAVIGGYSRQRDHSSNTIFRVVRYRLQHRRNFTNSSHSERVVIRKMHDRVNFYISQLIYRNFGQNSR